MRVSQFYILSADMFDDPDYFETNWQMTIQSGSFQVCMRIGAIDDELIEDIEFYQISLTSDDSAEVVQELSVANVFIEDNDGKLIIIIIKYKSSYC